MLIEKYFFILSKKNVIFLPFQNVAEKQRLCELFVGLWHHQQRHTRRSPVKDVKILKNIEIHLLVSIKEISSI